MQPPWTRAGVATSRRRLLQFATGAAVALPIAAAVLVLRPGGGGQPASPTSRGGTSGTSGTSGASGTPARGGSTPSTPATPAAPATAELRPAQVGIGEAMLVRAVVPGAASATARFRGIDTQLLPQPDGSFWAVLGVPLDQPPAAGLSIAITGRTAAGQPTAAVSPPVTIVAIDRPIDYLVASEATTAVLTPDAGAREDALRAQQFAAFDRLPLWKGVLLRPTPGEVTTHFGQGRSINGGPVGGFHSGVDFADSEGTPVRAAASGRVAFAGAMPIRGNSVIVDHGGGMKTGYHHLSAIEVETGQAVEAGKTVGQVGMTGFATGPHLHWELTVWGVNVDPVTWLTQPFAPGT